MMTYFCVQKRGYNSTSLFSLGSLDGADPAVVPSSSRTLAPVEDSEDPSLQMDDEDHSGESSGSMYSTKHL